jgi:4-hydroxy-4-methyl-2-oxoglutarate aldolase
VTQPSASSVLAVRGGRDHVGQGKSQVSVSHNGQDRAVTEIPDWLSSTLASDAANGSGALPTWIHALSPTVTVAGPALVVALSRDDNRPMRDVPAAVTQPGPVLVVAGGSESRTAILGDLVARELMTAGVVAVVTDGLIRDSRAVAELGLAVWARGTTPVASAKNGPGQVGGAVTVGGVVVHDGDLVVADADGVVVWPAAEISNLMAGADAKRQADDERLARLTAPPS